MYNVKIFGRSFDKLRVDENRGCIDLYADKDFIIYPKQIVMLNYEYSVNMGDNIIAVPYSKDRKFNLYYPNDFSTIKGYRSHLTVGIDGRSYKVEYEVKQGEYVATYRFMTTQFYKLMRTGKDKGLRSAFIKIELIYGD